MTAPPSSDPSPIVESRSFGEVVSDLFKALPDVVRANGPDFREARHGVTPRVLDRRYGASAPSPSRADPPFPLRLDAEAVERPVGTAHLDPDTLPPVVVANGPNHRVSPPGVTPRVLDRAF